MVEEAKQNQGDGGAGKKPETGANQSTVVRSNTPENKEGQVNPSAPEDSNTTPGSTAEAVE